MKIIIFLYIFKKISHKNLNIFEFCVQQLYKKLSIIQSYTIKKIKIFFHYVKIKLNKIVIKKFIKFIRICTNMSVLKYK